MTEVHEDYVFTMLTSDRCIKCLMCKSTGTIEDTFDDKGDKIEKVEFFKDRRMDKEFILKILNGGSVKVQELVFKGLNGLREDVTEIILYQLESQNSQNVITTKYREGGNGICEKRTGDGEYVSVGFNFEKMVNRSVPYRIYNFILIFPGFLLCKKSEWRAGIKDKNYFFRAHSLGCSHVDFLGGQTWIVNKSDTVKDITYMVDPVSVVDKLISGESTLDSRPEDLPPKTDQTDDGGEVNKIRKFVDIETIRGTLRGNDKGVPFSNGRPFSFVPTDYLVMY